MATAHEEEAASKQTLTLRQRREQCRNSMLMKAISDIAIVGGMSDAEAAQLLKDLETQNQEERATVLLSTIRTNATSGFKYFRPI